MELYGVTEKDMPPLHIRNLCLQISYSRFEFIPDPGLAIRAVYGLNLSKSERNHRSWWRRIVKTGNLLRDRRLKRGGLCIITK
mgnify:CR=1 FL=1